MTHHPDYSAEIALALATPGGHLSIGRGGASLHYVHYRYTTPATATYSGMNPDAIKPLAIAAGLPVIDSRGVNFDAVAHLAISGPMVAVGRDPDPAPYHSLSYAPLAVIAAAYRAAGAEVYNQPQAEEPAP
jgi:hypothetical protein